MKKKIIYLIIGAILFVVGGIYTKESVYAEAMNFTVKAILPENQINDSTYFDILTSPSQNQDISLELNNLSDKAITITVTPHDSYTNDNGIISYDKENVALSEKIPYKLTELISEKQIVYLNPNEKKIVSFQLKMPKERFSGYILGAFSIKEENNNKSITDIKNNKTKKNVAINNEFMYTIGIRIREDNQKVTPSVSLVSVTPQIVSNKPAIVSQLVNEAPEIISGIKVEGIVYKDNKEMYKLTKKNISLAPFSYFNFGIDTNNKELQSGNYKVKLKVTTDEKEWKFEKEFKIKRQEAKKINEQSIGLEKEEFNVWYIVIGIAILCIILLVALILVILKNRSNK
ncbi:hypothetical protein D930_00403 [Enterococcus faecalis KI-6-1-110608-1]|uniref:DUF916 and DUF3324 domain-containing protein n=1 Tax=Enterococcus faecalis TaxID=1351 RepID=UPI000352B81B|nr:DUF916 and DUF3324 domain-containing protein [Enterococcus faecalis]EIT2385333.1 DUF916 and DUF3324 domain-containing protein [Enterococcus faecalis]EPH70531.1 hypothetical protein D930_00403 [Enterococcus faecalis KI-6-1-110608-1]